MITIFILYTPFNYLLHLFLFLFFYNEPVTFVNFRYHQLVLLLLTFVYPLINIMVKLEYLSR